MARNLFRLRCLTLALVCLLAVGRALAQAPSAIQIFMPNGGMPPSAIRMTLTRDDGYTDIVFTDSKGKYQINTPRTQTVFYRVIIESDKLTYDTTTTSLTLDRNSPNQFNIFLRPLTTVKLPANAVLDVTNYEENVPAKARAAYKRAMEAVNKGQADGAISNLQQAISFYPQYVRALNDLGVVYLKLNRLDEAAATFRRAIEVNKRYFHPRLNLGLVLGKQGKYREALEILEPLYNENHGMLEMRLAYATALESAGELADAEKLWRSVVDSKSPPPAARADAHFGLGLIYNRQSKYSEAVAELEKAITLAPDAPNPHLQLGAALLQLKRLSVAERELLRAYELAGKAAGAAQLFLGQIYYEQKRFGEAEGAFRQYLKDVPAAPNAAQIAQLIADLKVSGKN
jgi:tetratricopeptide (TPR) repeat protein